MASKYGKRKIAKSKAGRASKMQQEEEESFDMDDMSPTAKLMADDASSRTTRRRGRGLSFGAVIGIFLVLCVVVIALAGFLAWDIHNKTNSVDTDSSDAPAKIRNGASYGLSTDNIFNNHQAPSLTADALRRVANAVNVQDLKSVHLNPLLIQRVSGTPGNQQARNHILSQLQTLGGGWDIEQHTFQTRAPEPFGLTSFTNIIATLNPAVKRRLVLACHYDSKYFPAPDVFIGATDSALPCAQLMYLAQSLNTSLYKSAGTNPPVTLQLIFFDGEEAFVRWTSRDSLYGSRKLATKMRNTPHPPGANTNLLEGIDMLVLLDLLGARNPVFYNFFENTSTWYSRMAAIEQRLKRAGLIQQRTPYFQGQQWFHAGMQDDHIPFLQKGVRILHLIPHPFPNVWHKLSDNADALDDTTISKLSKIFHVFVAEYLKLSV